MTIKFTCAGCGSVMKIKDDKAGTKAKCPKCKIPFVVPLLFESGEDIDDEAATAKASSRLASSDHGQPPDDEDDDQDNVSAEIPADEDDDAEDSVPERQKGLSREKVRSKAVYQPVVPSDVDDGDDLDMPLDVTPGTPSAPARQFDPLDVLDAKPEKSKKSSSVKARDRKASVADMMKGFESSLSAAASTPAPARENQTVSETTGTAADALARAYQQKRDDIANPKARPKPVDEERELFIAWLKKVVPAILGGLVFAYGLYWVINGQRYSGPPLASVAGTLTQGGIPMVNYQVRFVPTLTEEELTSSGDKDSPVPRAPSSGITDNAGKFILYYSADYAGSCTGPHTLEVLTPAGMPVFVPDGYLEQNVTDEGLDNLVIDLN